MSARSKRSRVYTLLECFFPPLPAPVILGRAPASDCPEQVPVARSSPPPGCPCPCACTSHLRPPAAPARAPPAHRHCQQPAERLSEQVDGAGGRVPRNLGEREEGGARQVKFLLVYCADPGLGLSTFAFHALAILRRGGGCPSRHAGGKRDAPEAEQGVGCGAWQEWPAF